MSTTTGRTWSVQPDRAGCQFELQLWPRRAQLAQHCFSSSRTLTTFLWPSSTFDNFDRTFRFDQKHVRQTLWSDQELAELTAFPSKCSLSSPLKWKSSTGNYNQSAGAASMSNIGLEWGLFILLSRLSALKRVYILLLPWNYCSIYV